jgi:hypothetical protein
LALLLAPGHAARAQGPPNPTPAPADGADTRVWRRMLSIEGHVGDTPYGVGAASLSFTPLPYLSATLGAGLSLWGVHGAIMPRVQLPVGDTAVSFELGPSWGPRESSDTFIDPSWTARYDDVWLNAGVGVEHRWVGGFDLRGYGGASRVMQVLSAKCLGGPSSCPNSDVELGRTSAYFGFAIGYAL